jgi:subtilisin family serine protease
MVYFCNKPTAMMNFLFRISIIFLCSLHVLYAQEADPMIVRINYAHLNLSVIDDQSTLVTNFKDVLNSRGVEEIETYATSHPEILEFELYKIFPHLNSRDTSSISRQGRIIPMPPFWATFRLLVPQEHDYWRTMQDLDKMTRLIDFVHPEFEVQFASTPNDSLYTQQLSLNGGLPNAHINIEQAWMHETGEPWIKVAVHDNGIDTTHEDLDVLTGAAYNSSNSPETAWGYPGNHGTPVAGIIGAKRNDSIGISGIAGGNGLDSTGISLVDMSIAFGANVGASYFMAGVVDAAREVGTYWNYTSSPDALSGYFNLAKGFGVHVGNHSYILRLDLPPKPSPAIPDDSNTEVFTDCQMCREAFLFSLRSGVINVVARGNSSSVPTSNPMHIDDMFPQSLPDNWILSIGASGYDGVTVQTGLNQNSNFPSQETTNNYYSLYGGDMDLIAPGSDSIVYTTGGNTLIPNTYHKMSGTSAAAPHVAGVAALLLSHHNKNCYSKGNLTIEDVEYLLEHSATDLYSSGYDDTTGWGRLNAGAAMEMIASPTKQIVHPDSLISSIAIETDTIALRYETALIGDNWGPISTPWQPERQHDYQVVRILMENTYFIGHILDTTTTILDAWALPSISNAVEKYNDTTRIYQLVIPMNPNVYDTTLALDTFNLEPYTIIDTINLIDKTVKTRGYYYHFINQYVDRIPSLQTLDPDSLEINTLTNINYWYPKNPLIDTANLLFSLYLSDTTWTQYHDYPCDSMRILVEEDYPLHIDEFHPNHWEVYPNPFENRLIVHCSLNGRKTIEIFDIKGSLILSKQTDEPSHIINTKDLLPGLYFLNCSTLNNSRTYKLIRL